ncbi:MAG: glycosyltransferase family 39 protein [Eubacterium sp.]|nr:glycosyltransferase family 39 protein [Eubacterium sp.]
MKEHNIETRILLLLCTIFWVFQSLGETQRVVWAGVFSALMIATMLLSNQTREQFRYYIIAGYVQCISFWMMMVFGILKENQAVHLANVRIALVIFSVLLICIILPFWMAKKKVMTIKIQKVEIKGWIYTAMLAGYILRQFQVFVTNVMQQQNDIGTFSERSLGHLGYIYKIYKHTALPDGNPMQQYQYYQPPFSHIVMGIWAKINSLFGMTEEVIAENLQVLALFFSTMILIVAYKIMKEVTKSQKGILAGILVIAFFPYLLEYAGAVNNDTLSTLLGLVTVLYMIRWYKNSQWKDIIICALAIGCGMMAKLSVAMLAPAMACVFLYKMIKNKSSFLFFIKQYLTFGVISIPLGIWFPVKNLILYNVPLNFVPVIGWEQGQYMGNLYTVPQRLFEVTWSQLKPLWLSQMRGTEEFTYNIGVMFTKYCAFGETRYFPTTQWSKFIGTLMYVMILLLFVFAIALVVAWLRKAKCGKVIKFLLLGSAGMVLVSYVKFCFDYPSVCTANVRYVLVSIVLIFCMMAAGIGQMKNTAGQGNMIVRNIFKCFLAAYVCINTIGLLSLLYNL